MTGAFTTIVTGTVAVALSNTVDTVHLKEKSHEIQKKKIVHYQYIENLRKNCSNFEGKFEKKCPPRLT